MKNFKKLFAVAASVMMIASTVPTAVLGATTYSEELQGAYDYAYGIGATTQSSIDNANMFGSLIRSNMAKMMVNYAKEVKGMTADTSLACHFTDVANQTEEMQGYITEACQMGLMGQGITAFNPNGVVTRAQFGTVLDRVLNGAANDGGDPYYADHLAALKDAGVMTKTDTPNAPEVRGYVMLMMQRAAEGGTNPAICDTPENTLSCSLGLSTCPAECAAVTETKNGALNVSLDSSSPAAAEIPGSIPSFKTVVYKLTADKDVRLDSVVLKRAGFGASDAILSAALFADGARISKNSTFNSTTDEVTLNITNGYQMKAGETLKLAVNTIVEASAGNVGKTFNITLKSVASSAQDVSLASNLTSETFKVAAADVAIGTLTQYSSVADPKVGQVNAEMFKFQIENANNNKSITLKSMMFKQIGDSDVNTNLSNFKLLADGTEIATATALNGKYLTFNNVNFEILKNKTPKFAVTANVNGAAGKTIQFSIEKKMDIVATDSTYNQGANIYLINSSNDTLSFTSKSVSAGKVTLNRINPTSTDLLKNKKDVVLGQMELNNNAGKTLNLKSFGLKVRVSTAGSDGTTVAASTILENLRVKVNNGSSYELTYAGLSGYSDTSIDIPLPAGKTTLTVLVDTKDVAVSSYKVDMSWKAATPVATTIQEMENDVTVTDVSPTSLDWRQIQGIASSATVTNVSLAPRTFVAGTDAVEVLRFKIKAGSASLINLKELNFSGNAALTDTTIKSATLTWADGTASATIAAGKLTFNGMNINVAANAEKEVSLAVGITKSTATSSFFFEADPVNYTAEDKDGSPTTVDLSTAVGRVITIASV
ncbi:MAG: S-layer homology domain-containing protein, partial [candidate division SR1 bacterium]|nr:S-layer homology domain-containing protein [candidate division SR1 bacterium]